MNRNLTRAIANVIEREPPSPPPGKIAKTLRWIIWGAGGLCLVFWGLLFVAISGIGQTVVGRTDRPDWLPKEATRITYYSQGGLAWSRTAKFTIAEESFRAYATERGWTVEEVKDYRLPWKALVIPRALIYEKRLSNAGGISVAFNCATSRAYYDESGR